MISDPPLLRLETESSHSYLSVLVHTLLAPQPFPSSALTPSSEHSCNSSSRIVDLSVKILQRYSLSSSDPLKLSPSTPVSSQKQGLNKQPTPTHLTIGHTSSGLQVLMATPMSEYGPFSPLLSSMLTALGHESLVSLDSFKEGLTRLFPLLVSLIRSEVLPREVARALSDLLLKRIGPLAGCKA